MNEKTNEFLEKLISIELVKIMKSRFKSEEEKLVFILTDGKNGTREIAKMANMNKDSISRLWKKWEKIGIVKKEGKRYKRTI